MTVLLLLQCTCKIAVGKNLLGMEVSHSRKSWWVCVGLISSHSLSSSDIHEMERWQFWRSTQLPSETPWHCRTNGNVCLQRRGSQGRGWAVRPFDVWHSIQAKKKGRLPIYGRNIAHLLDHRGGDCSLPLPQGDASHFVRHSHVFCQLEQVLWCFFFVDRVFSE